MIEKLLFMIISLGIYRNLVKKNEEIATVWMILLTFSVILW